MHIKKNLLTVCFMLLIVINISVLILKSFTNKSQSALSNSYISDFDKGGESESYNTPCPTMVLNSINNRVFNTKDLIGDVLLIKFSRFYRNDLANLIYLEHLARRFEDDGLHLFFINSRGKHDKNAINSICNFTYPIIEETGYISSAFNAKSEDTIIVDRNFKIRFKLQLYPIFNKLLIFNEVKRWIYNENPTPIISPSKEELSSTIDNLLYYNVLSKEEKTIQNHKSNKNVILTIFTSTCTGCRENERIRLLKELSSQINYKKDKIVILFGIGNNPKAIKQFASLNNWNKYPIEVGIINSFGIVKKDIYIRLFSLDIDPRTFIIGKNRKLIFAEDTTNSRQINLRFLSKTR